MKSDWMYSALALRLMGFEKQGVFYSKGKLHFTRDTWTPLTDYNQAYHVLKAAEKAGLRDTVIQKIIALPNCPSTDREEFNLYDFGFFMMTLEPSDLVKACVDVWLEWQVEQEPIPEPTSFLDDAKEKFYQHLDSYHLQKAQEENPTNA